jgi:hypothetical protein
MHTSNHQPVVYQCPSCGGFCKQFGCERQNVSPQREWVGLTDEEIWAEGADNVLDVYFARDIEAKLKEKNCPSAD